MLFIKIKDAVVNYVSSWSFNYTQFVERGVILLKFIIMESHYFLPAEKRQSQERLNARFVLIFVSYYN